MMDTRLCEDDDEVTQIRIHYISFTGGAASAAHQGNADDYLCEAADSGWPIRRT